MMTSKTSHHRNTARAVITIAAGLLLLFGMSGCAATQPVAFPVKVTTTPSDALVSIGSSNGRNDLDLQAVAGTTPLEKNFAFGPQNKIWLQIEKRGYAPRQVPVTPETARIALDLDRLYGTDGKPVPGYSLPAIRRMLLVPVDFDVYQRGFSSEKISKEESFKARQALNAEIAAVLHDQCEVVIASDKSDAPQLRSLRRDGHTAMLLSNPIRLRYQAEPPLLETTSGRSAAQTLGSKYNTDVILLVDGKQILETASMVAGKIGMTAIGTASSYASGYSRAMANGDSFFTYTVYTPHFSQGAHISALMIDCRNAEVLWTNQGYWKPINFADSRMVDTILEDLFTGLPSNKGDK